MNIYNLDKVKNEKYSYDLYADMLISKSRKHMNFIICLILFSAAACMYISSLYYGKWIFLELYFLIGWCIYFRRVSYNMKLIKKAEKNSAQTLHDFYYSYYKKTNKLKNRNIYLLNLCICNILTKDYSKAYESLECVNCSNISNKYKRKFYLIKSVLEKLSGNDDEFIKSIRLYEDSSLSRKNKLEAQENIKTLRIGETNQILGLINIQKDINEYSSFIKYILYFFRFILFTFLFSNIKYYLPGNIEYRSWVEWIGSVVIYGGTIAFPIVFFFNLIKTKYSYEKVIKRISYSIFALLSIVYVVFSSLYLFALGSYTKEQRIDDNTIEVTELVYLYGNESYYCKPVSIFFREVITNNEDYLEDTDDEEHIEYSNNETNNVLNNNDIFYEENYDDQNTTLGEESNSVMGYHKIYDVIFANKGDTLEFRTSAKGRTYAVIGPEETKELYGEKLKVSKKLEYDRESKNNECYLYVLYEEHYNLQGDMAKDSSILNFYAVKKSTGRVIAANKTSWEQSGSSEYHDATGEW